jgi:hypothetical protein
MIKFRGTLPIILGFICLTSHAYTQTLLDRKISIEVTNQRMADVLKQISSKGNFFFSYNSNIIKNDSLISFSAANKSLKQILDQLCNSRYTWKLNNNYIILRKTVAPPAVVTSQTPSVEKIYTVTGYVMNSETGEKVSNVSIYEKDRLVSTLSDDKGFFKIKLKSRYSTASLTISREMFEDTTVVIQPKYNQQVTIVMTPVAASEPVVTISPSENELPDTIVVKAPTDTLTTLPLARQDVNQVEKTRWGKFFLSAKQNIQSINLKKFFADRTFQVSLTPGLSTHGKLGSQVVNNFSVNVIGGYTAGVNGVELGGAFNINKKDVKYVQAAGLLNITGGSVTGVQLAGLHSNVLKDVNGIQASGISNFVKGNVTGIQLSSIYNHVHGSVTGIQASNFSNYIKGNLVGVQLGNFFNHVSDSVTGLQATNIINSAGKGVTGAQLSAIGNVSRGELKGAQVAALFNYAKKLRGVQIGLINISDTSEGYSIGLVNIVFKGYHKLILSTNEVLDVNAAFKTGNSKLYSILLTGYRKRKDDSSTIISFGYGLGHEFAIGKRFSINPEFTSQYLYLGNWEYANAMSKLHVQFTVKLNKYISIFAGPSFTAYYSTEEDGHSGYFLKIPSTSYHTFDLWNKEVKGWIGWNAGISFF